jgi:hypothetical protein
MTNLYATWFERACARQCLEQARDRFTQVGLTNAYVGLTRTVFLHNVYDRIFVCQGGQGQVRTGGLD